MSRPEGPCTAGALSVRLLSLPPSWLDQLALVALGSEDLRILAKRPDYASSLISSGRTSREDDSSSAPA
eukprot:3651004-Pleurochrysis_carterae.AAC.1